MSGHPSSHLDGADPPFRYKALQRRSIVGQSKGTFSERVTLLPSANYDYGTTPTAARPRRTMKTPQTKQIAIILYILSMLLISALFSFCTYGAIGLFTQDQLRRQWASEATHRAEVRQRWLTEERDHEDTRRKMLEEIDVLDRQIADGKKTVKDIEKERQDWDRERERQERILEEERRADEERRQAERREKEREERQREEEESRKRDAIVWTGLEAGHCLRYGVREYTAAITQVPVGFESVMECWRKPVEIHGRQWLPTRCEPEDQCPSGKVVGHWEVSLDEGTCRPYWDSFIDKGCVAPGVRRYTSHLMNVRDFDNWEAVCITAPASINGRHYDGPNSCESVTFQGIWGVWDVEEDSCP